MVDLSELEYLLQSAGVNTRRVTHNTEVAICCYICGDQYYKLYLNPNVVSHGIQGFGYCHRRGCTVTLERLARHFHIDLDLSIVDKPTVNSFEAFKLKMNMVLNGTALTPTHKLPPDFDLEQFPSPLKCFNFMGKRARNYLHGRNFTDDQIERYNLRFAETGDYAGRIIIPFYENEKLVYFQARSFMLAPKMKIMNPTIDMFEEGKSHYLFNFDQARLHRQCIITESWGSSIASGPSAVGLNGCSISPVQLAKLLANWDDFVIMLDYGVENRTYEAVQLLLFSKPKIRVKAVFLPYGDPNSVPIGLLTHLIMKAKVYNSLEEVILEKSRFLLKNGEKDFDL